MPVTTIASMLIIGVHIHVCVSFPVLYAADLGPCGLDIGTTYSRAEVYALKSSDNVPLGYLPEDDSFPIVSISVG